MEAQAKVVLTPEEIGELLKYANLGSTAKKLVDALIEQATPVWITDKAELDALPVETAIRMGQPGKQRVRVKNCDGRWVGTASEGHSSVESQQVLYWYTKVQVLNHGDGWKL